MRATSVPWDEIGPDIAAKWIEIRGSNPALASPYFHPKFAGVVAHACRNVELAIIEERNEVAALFPFQRLPGNLGAPLGRSLSDYHGLIGAEDYECDPRYLVRQCNLIAWDFDHLIASQRSFGRFHESVAPSPQIDLSLGFEAYCQTHGETKSLRMKMRRLERDYGTIRFVPDSSEQGAMQQIIIWKTEQYKKADFWNPFTEQWAASIVHEISRVRERDFAGLLSLLYAGDLLVAAQFGMRSESTYHYWFPAYDPKMAYYSPGSILLLKMACHLSSAGIKTIDLGKGMSEQKRRFMNASVGVATGAVDLSFLRCAQRMVRNSIRSLAVQIHLYRPARAGLRAFR
jgi:CelD/BcsL family acetyltransferase involved in cellulose biosynthesis